MGKLILRKYEKEYGITFVVRNDLQKLVDLLKSKGYSFTRVSENYIQGIKDDVKMDIRKNRAEYLVVITSESEKKIHNMIKATQIVNLEIIDGKELDPSRLLDNSDTWIHSDIWGESMLDMGEILVETLNKFVNKKIKTFWLLKNMDSYDVTMDIILNKFKKNENHFYGNIRMFNTLLQTTALNYMITLNRQKQELQTLSLSHKCGEDAELSDFIECKSTVKESEIIEKVMLSKLSEVEMKIVSRLREGYKFDEICSELKMDRLTLISTAEKIRLS